MYKIIGCSYCHNFMTTQASTTVKCFFCGRSQTMKTRRIFYKSENMLEAREALKYITEHKELFK